MLRELKSLFHAFDICPVGNLGKCTIDPTGLRVALAELDAKRFAAGASVLSSRQHSTPSQADACLVHLCNQMLMLEAPLASISGRATMPGRPLPAEEDLTCRGDERCGRGAGGGL